MPAIPAPQASHSRGVALSVPAVRPHPDMSDIGEPCDHEDFSFPEDFLHLFDVNLS
jgi:hypothetical protein